MSTFSFSEIDSLAQLLTQNTEKPDIPKQGADYQSSYSSGTTSGYSGVGCSQNHSVVSPGDIGSSKTQPTLADSATSRIRQKKYDKYNIWTDEEVDNEVYFEPPDDRVEPQFVIVSYYSFHTSFVVPLLSLHFYYLS